MDSFGCGIGEWIEKGVWLTGSYEFVLTSCLLDDWFY